MRIRAQWPLRRLAPLTATLLLTTGVARAQDPPAPTPEESEAWSFGVSLYGYFSPDGPYGQPTVTADRGIFHAEARYNYEDLETTSLWLGANFAFGEEVTLEVTPIVGVVFGETDGVAAGFKLGVGFWKLEFYSEGEYLVDLDDSADNFFYSWNELTISPLEGLRLGLVAQRTRAYESELDIQRGFILGFSKEAASLAVHLFDPDQDDPTVVVSMGFSF